MVVYGVDCPDGGCVGPGDGGGGGGGAEEAAQVAVDHGAAQGVAAAAGVGGVHAGFRGG